MFQFAAVNVSDATDGVPSARFDDAMLIVTVASSQVESEGEVVLALDEDVEAGAMLGTVGDTGSLKGAYLYFEIREHGKPLDPKSWLLP